MAATSCIRPRTRACASTCSMEVPATARQCWSTRALAITTRAGASTRIGCHMFRQLGIFTVAILAAVGAYAAQPRAEDFIKLKDEMARLNAQQQQILGSLDELKRMIKGPGQPALKAPETMSVAGEPFKGQPSATLAIIEYADFQCPFCRRFEQ